MRRPKLQRTRLAGGTAPTCELTSWSRFEWKAPPSGMEMLLSPYQLASTIRASVPAFSMASESAAPAADALIRTSNSPLSVPASVNEMPMASVCARRSVFVSTNTVSVPATLRERLATNVPTTPAPKTATRSPGWIMASQTMLSAVSHIGGKNTTLRGNFLRKRVTMSFVVTKRS